MKYSKQRELVLNAVLDNRIHPTADFIYSLLREGHPNISLGTVYRNLNVLAEHGLIHRIPISGGCDRFDGRLDEHYHMICEHCGEVFDVELDGLRHLDREIENRTGFTVKGHELIISGVCTACKEKETCNQSA